LTTYFVAGLKIATLSSYLAHLVPGGRDLLDSHELRLHRENPVVARKIEAMEETRQVV